MAMNWGVFRTRALTALLFVAVMSAGLFTNLQLFFLLFTIIHFGCWYEYQKLMVILYPQYETISSFHRYGVRIAGWAGMLLATSDQIALWNISLAAVGFWILLLFAFILPIAEILFTKELNAKNALVSLIGLVYISLSFSLIIHLRSGAIWLSDQPGDGLNSFFNSFTAVIGGFYIPIMIIASIWMNDTFAYIVGSFIGKTPLSAISPKKTWEGTIGGILLCVGIMSYVGFTQHAWPDYLLIALISSIAGTFGDLFESKLKRMAGVKDSGHFMPGHGGFLDRFDSLLFAIPCVWLYVFLFMR